LQVSMIPSAFWILKAAGDAAGDTADAGDAAGDGLASGEGDTATADAGLAATAGDGLAAGIRRVSPDRPATMVLKISLSAGTPTYLTTATSIETKIKAAHILLNAM
jgi:hypothetical protein